MKSPVYSKSPSGESDTYSPCECDVIRYLPRNGTTTGLYFISYGVVRICFQFVKSFETYAMP